MTPKNRPAAGDAGKGQGKSTTGEKKIVSPDASGRPQTSKTSGPVRQTPAATKGLLLRQDRSALSQLAQRRASTTSPTDPNPASAPVSTSTTNPTDSSSRTTPHPSMTSNSASGISSNTARDTTLDDHVASTFTSSSTDVMDSAVASKPTDAVTSRTARKQTRNKPAPAPVAPSQVDVGESSPAPEARPTKRDRTSTSTPKPAAGAADPRLDEKKAVTFYIDTTLRKQLKLFADRNHLSQTLVTLHALSLPDATLAELVEQDRQSQVVESLDRFGVILKPRSDLNEAKQQVGMRMTPRQLQVIDKLRDKAGARDRSHLINLALRAYLDQN